MFFGSSADASPAWKTPPGGGEAASRAAPAVAVAPKREVFPVRALAAARPAAGTYAPSSQDPTFIGELSLKTRSMCRKTGGPAQVVDECRHG